MFTGQLPQYLDPRKYADQGRVIEGQLPVGELSRLQDLEDSLDNPVLVALRFSRDQEGRCCIAGEVSAMLSFTCQRCLAPVQYNVSSSVNVAVVWNEEQAKALPDALDPLIVNEKSLVLSELLEEELILAMPILAVHDICPDVLVESAQEDDPESTERENPFAVLASLKRDGN